MMEAMIPSQVGMRLRTLKIIKEANEAQIKKEAEDAQKNKKMREREKGQCYYLFFHTCASK